MLIKIKTVHASLIMLQQCDPGVQKLNMQLLTKFTYYEISLLIFFCKKYSCLCHYVYIIYHIKNQLTCPLVIKTTKIYYQILHSHSYTDSVCLYNSPACPACLWLWDSCVTNVVYKEFISSMLRVCQKLYLLQICTSIQ